jgi:hypothetical protein
VRRGKPSRPFGGGSLPLKTSGSDGHAGACRSGAPGGAGASSGSSKNPMEAADLQQIRRFAVGERPWGAGSKHHGSPRRRGLKRARGRAGAKALATAADDVLRRGLGGSGTTAVEPEWAGSSALESAELSTSYSSEYEAVEHRGREGAGVQRCTTAFLFERASRARTP